VYPEDQQAKNYSDKEIDDYRKSHKDIIEPEHHKYAKLVLFITLVLLAGTVIGLSYFLTNNKNESNENETVITQQENLETEDNKQEQAVAISQNWLEFKSTEYDIKIPDGWTTIHQDNGVLLMSCDSKPDCYDLVEGTLATVEETIGGRDGLQGFLFVINTEGTIQDYTDGYTFVKEIVDGYSLYSREQTDLSEDNLVGESLPVGTEEFIAIKLLDDGKVPYFSYSVTPEQTNPAILVEEMITTLLIK
jgi:hypothetical protein